MNDVARFYSLYTSIFGKVIRLFIFVFLFWLFLNNPQRFFWLSVFLMVEVFFHFKIARNTPKFAVRDNPKNIYDSFSLKAFSFFISSKTSIGILKSFLSQPQIRFILRKADISEKEIKFLEISKELLGKLAFENAKLLNGKFVTTMDLFVSYLIFTEDQTKLLFNKKLKKEELLDILYWARTNFVTEEVIKPLRIEFWEEGIGEAMVSGWTIETRKYMVDITKEVLSKKPLLLGREEEYRNVIEALNNGKPVLLVGEPGSGKSTLVQSIAFESFMGNIKGKLYHMRINQLLTDALLSGTQNQGQLQERMDSVIAELSHAGNIIVYVPNFEGILGSSSFDIDLSGVLIPYLQKGVIKLIASVTPGSYKRFVEGKHTLASIFETVRFSEPARKFAFQMLLQKTSEIEIKNKVSISYRAVVAAGEFANKYLPGKVMPGAGVTLLEDAANAVSLSGRKIVEEQDVVDKVEAKTKIAIGVPKEKERDLLLHLEDELHKYIVDQNEAVFEVAESLRRLRAGINTKEKPISFLFLGPTGVGKTQTAKALSKVYFGDEKNMIRFDMSEYGENGSVDRFLGKDGSGLTDMVFDHPFSLVLLDEFEKSNTKIIDLFLQVLDDGRLTDVKGRTVSFVDTIIIATSNAASEYIREEVEKGTKIDKNFQRKLLEFLQEKEVFRPELLNRFDGIIVFKPLGDKEIYQITKLILLELAKKLLEKDIVVDFNEKIIGKISKEGFDEEFGARPLNRFIQDNIEDLIAQKILKNEIKRGDKVSISIDSSNNLRLAINS